MSDFTIDLNFEGTERLKDWEPVPDGNYTLTIEDVTRQPATQAGKADNIKVVFGVNEEEGRKFTKWFNLGEKSLPFLQKFLEELYGQEIGGSVSLTPQDMIGKQIGATLVVRPRQDDPDKLTNEVIGSSWVNIPF